MPSHGAPHECTVFISSPPHPEPPCESGWPRWVPRPPVRARGGNWAPLEGFPCPFLASLAPDFTLIFNFTMIFNLTMIFNFPETAPKAMPRMPRAPVLSFHPSRPILPLKKSKNVYIRGCAPIVVTKSLLEGHFWGCLEPL